MTDRSVEVFAGGADDQLSQPAQQFITVTSIASAEVVNAVAVAGPITVTGIPSAEAFGTPKLNLTIYPASIPSAEAFGTPTIVLYIRPNAIPSAEAFGSPTLNLIIYPASIPSAEAFGATVVSAATLIFPNGVPSAEAFGSPTLNLTIYPASVPSAEAFGSPHLNLTIYPASIASAEAFGSVHMGVIIRVDAIPSAEAFGAPTLTVGQVVTVIGIPSQEAFGTPVVAGPIILVGIPSAEAFGTPRVHAFGMLEVVAGSEGIIDGGTQMTLTGFALDTQRCSDDFSSGLIDPLKWNVLTAGSGLVVPYGDRQLVTFDSRTVAGSLAGLRSVSTMLNTDIEADYDFVASVVPAALANVMLASLALRVDANNEFRLDVQEFKSGVTLRVLARVGGMVQLDQSRLVTSRRSAGVVLRLIRLGSRVLGFMNNVQVVDALWSPTAANAELLVRNDATVGGSRVVSNVTAFVHRALVSIGGQPVITYPVRTPGHVVAVVPRAEAPGVVDVIAYGCTAQDQVLNGFTYLLGNRKTVGRDSTRELVILNDPAVKETA